MLPTSSKRLKGGCSPTKIRTESWYDVSLVQSMQVFVEAGDVVISGMPSHKCNSAKDTSNHQGAKGLLDE